jgi:hypothetical protein
VNTMIAVGIGTTIIAMCSASFALIAMGIDIIKNWREKK